MFAYCNNNPVTCADPTGEFPWLLVFAGISGAAINALVTFATGGSAWDILASSVKGGVSGIVIAIAPSSAFVFAGYEAGNSFLNYLYEGYSPGDSAIASGVVIASSVAFRSTGDPFADMIVEASFGTGKALVSAAAIELIENQEKKTVSNHSITSNLIASFSIGSGGGPAFTHIFTDNGGNNLWYKP